MASKRPRQPRHHRIDAACGRNFCYPAHKIILIGRSKPSPRDAALRGQCRHHSLYVQETGGGLRGSSTRISCQPQPEATSESPKAENGPTLRVPVQSCKATILGYAFTAFFLPSLTLSSLTRSSCSDSGAKARKQRRAFSESSPSSLPIPRPRPCSLAKRSKASPNTSHAVTGDGSSARLEAPGTSGGMMIPRV